MFRRNHFVPQNDADLNEERVKALGAKYGDQTPFVAVAVLGALTQFVAPDALAKAIIMGELAVLKLSSDGSVVPLKETLPNTNSKGN
jgi:hypothetical protein